MPRPFALAFVALLGCSSGGAPAPDDHPLPPVDAFEAPDVVDVPTKDVSPDAGPPPQDRETPRDAPDVQSVDATDAPVDLGVRDTGTSDTSSFDGGTDAPDGVDVQVADVPVDTGPPPCTADTYRCGTFSGQPYMERCVDGTWRPWQGCGGYNLSTNRNGVCPTGETTCQFCTGRDCMPMCSEDLDCAMRGYGRCDRGRCLHRGAVACATRDDCDVIGLGRTLVECTVAPFYGTMERLCAGAVWCSSDAMCPAGWRCNGADGHCAR
jgi:hypothetical protein